MPLLREEPADSCWPGGRCGLFLHSARGPEAPLAVKMGPLGAERRGSGAPLPLPQAPSTLALAWKWPGHSVGGFQFPELPVCWEGTGGQWGR